MSKYLTAPCGGEWCINEFGFDENGKKISKFDTYAYCEACLKILKQHAPLKVPKKKEVKNNTRMTEFYKKL
jgi:hypothetical protein